MSWRWSRLAILAFLVLLYASPLSSGDKGLWLSVASMPVPLFGALPGGALPEHSILLPDRAELARAQACSQRGEPALDAWLTVVHPAAIDLTATTTRDLSAESTLDAIYPALSASRGPPA